MNSFERIFLTVGLALSTSLDTNTKEISAQIKEIFEAKAPEQKDFNLKEDTISTVDWDYIVSSDKKADVSWYWTKFHGKKTASGKIFDKNKSTAAHKTLPFGTKVLLIDEKTQDSVVVEVTDRWPYVKGRELDVSEWAAKHLWNLKLAWHKKLIVKVLKPLLEETQKPWVTT